jgi:hypothetical protein
MARRRGRVPLAIRRRRRGAHVTSTLYRAARLSNDLGTLASGKPSRMVRRGKNKIVGRVLGRLRVWRFLWRR